MARTAMTRDDILADPDGAKAALDSIQDLIKDPMPVADLPPDDTVVLPGGLIHKGDLIRHVTVRELNGEHEEAIAKAMQHPNQYRFIDQILRCGVDRVGDLSPDESQKVLGNMLIGDRDEILLGVRRATYGDAVEVFNWLCPECGGKVDELGFSITEDVKRDKLTDPATEAVFDVKLRGGASAKARLVTGKVQLDIYEQTDLTTPQRNDVILAACIETYTDRRGNTHLIPGFPSMVRKMATSDRQAILRELTKRQPGPRYNDVRFEHDGCGKEVSLALGITDFFRELIVAVV